MSRLPSATALQYRAHQRELERQMNEMAYEQLRDKIRNANTARAQATLDFPGLWCRTPLTRSL